MQVDCPNCQHGLLVPEKKNKNQQNKKTHKENVAEITEANRISNLEEDARNVTPKFRKPVPEKVFRFIVMPAIVLGFVFTFVFGGTYILEHTVPFVKKMFLRPTKESAEIESKNNTGIIEQSHQKRPANLNVEMVQTTVIDSATDNGEYTSFYKANVIFNRHDYANAKVAYITFIKNYPTSSRIPIVHQRLADIHDILNSENIANTEKDEYEIIYESVIGSLPKGESPNPDVFVRGYGSDKLSAFKDAFDSLPEDVQRTKGRIHAVEFEGSSCKITFW